MEITVLGTVQGVGFRPFVYRLAGQFNLAGTILNTDQGVVIEVEGEESLILSFIDALTSVAPPLARITSLRQRSHKSLKGFTDFSILKSLSVQHSQALIPADIALCNDCLQEIIDPQFLAWPPGFF